MSQYDELKRLAEAAKDDPESPYIPCQVGFLNAATPEVVLFLIAENERLHAMTETTMGVGSGEGSLFVHGDYDSIKAAQAIVIDRDELRAEVAGLRTGYQAYERVNAGLKAEVESLRKEAERYRFLRNGPDGLDLSSADTMEEVDALIDAAMGNGGQS